MNTWLFFQVLNVFTKTHMMIFSFDVLGAYIKPSWNWRCQTQSEITCFVSFPKSDPNNQVNKEKTTERLFFLEKLALWGGYRLLVDSRLGVILTRKKAMYRRIKFQIPKIEIHFAIKESSTQVLALWCDITKLAWYVMTVHLCEFCFLLDSNLCDHYASHVQAFLKSWRVKSNRFN